MGIFKNGASPERFINADSPPKAERAARRGLRALFAVKKGAAAKTESEKDGATPVEIAHARSADEQTAEADGVLAPDGERVTSTAEDDGTQAEKSTQEGCCEKQTTAAQADACPDEQNTQAQTAESSTKDGGADAPTDAGAGAGEQPETPPSATEPAASTSDKTAPQPERATRPAAPSVYYIDWHDPAPKSDEELSAERTETEYLAQAIGGSRLAAECRFYRPFLASGAACALCALLLLAPLTALHFADGLCYIYEDGALKGIALASAQQPAEAFERAGVELGPADAVETELLGSTAYMSVVRAHDITVVADGETFEHSVLGKNAREALAELGISVGENDRVSPADDAPLTNGDVVTLERIRYEYRDVVEAVPWRTVTKPSPLIDDGETLVMDEGEQRDGEALRTYRDVYADGELERSEVVAEIYDRYPWDLVYLEGKSDAPMSSLDGGDFTDIPVVNNAPLIYKRLLENSVCTAYSYNPGTWGASGMYLVQGFVAVDTSVIPYGSLLYITSPSGKFTYGWAVAADVGEAMVAGYVDIDLFFETYRESALFGKHRMNVYVVKQLTQSELEKYIANEGMFRLRVPE